MPVGWQQLSLSLLDWCFFRHWPDLGITPVCEGITFFLEICVVAAAVLVPGKSFLAFSAADDLGIGRVFYRCYRGDIDQRIARANVFLIGSTQARRRLEDQDSHRWCVISKTKGIEIMVLLLSVGGFNSQNIVSRVILYVSSALVWKQKDIATNQNWSCFYQSPLHSDLDCLPLLRWDSTNKCAMAGLKSINRKP